MHPIIEQLMGVAEIYQKTYSEDAAIVIADTEVVQMYLPGEKIDFKVPVGAPIEAFKGTVAYKAYETGQCCQEERGPEQFGLPYISTATPIIVDGEVIGVVTSMMSNARIDTVRSSATELAAMVEELTASNDEMHASSQGVSDRVQGVYEVSQSMMAQVEQLEAITQFVQDVASQSHMLGLNAAIEAARVGEAGRGFKVVADEIRKMAQSSKESAQKIAAQLKEMRDAIQSVNRQMQDVAVTTETHVASMEEMKGAFDHIAATADRLSGAAAVMHES